jgi:hypothetical protein
MCLHAKDHLNFIRLDIRHAIQRFDTIWLYGWLLTARSDRMSSDYEWYRSTIQMHIVIAQTDFVNPIICHLDYYQLLQFHEFHGCGGELIRSPLICRIGFIMEYKIDRIRIACLIESYGHKNLHRNFSMSLELMLFFPYDPRLVNSYRIHFLIYQTHRKGKKIHRILILWNLWAIPTNQRRP